MQEIEGSLKIARKRGLQFAIFNSCNGINIAEFLINLGLSQVAVMREPIHDQVAQIFNDQKGTEEIWTDKPVFFWRGVGVTQIDIFERGNDEVFATLKVKEGLTKIKYNGKPLQPGQSYAWQITAEKVRGLPIKDSGSNFTMMGNKERASITDDLTKLEATLKKKGANVEKIALEKADYFAKKEMWTDVLEQLYSVQNPSPQLMDTIKNIEGHNFCNPKQAAVSTLP
ncbi:MAG: DUF928 domain-containing protein [Heteroscytonema crispum UTEX LB 1556]